MMSRYRFQNIPEGGSRFWKASKKKSRSILNSAKSWGKRNGVSIKSVMVDGGVWVLNMEKGMSPAMRLPVGGK